MGALGKLICKCGNTHNKYGGYLKVDGTFVCEICIRIDLIKLIGQIGNELMSERESVSEKIIVQQTISRLVTEIDERI